MNEDELVAYKYLKTIYNEADISFEPNGYKTYPDFICDNCNQYEVTGLYTIDSDRTNIQMEKPILDHIEKLVNTYNRNEHGYYLDITIDGHEQPCRKALKNWFCKNQESVINTELSTGCLTIELIKQDHYEEKYVIGGIDNLNGSSWLIPAHTEAIKHSINKKGKKMSKNATLILVNHVFPTSVDNVFQDIGNIDFGIVILDIHSRKQHEWPNKTN